MKRIIFCFAVAMSALFISNCSNEIDLTTDWKDIPIVYGLVSKNDSLNYIRVEKAFLDGSKNALELAQIPDSLYYDNITVQLKGVHSGTPVTYDLFQVDGNLEGFPREEGIFADAPNYLYKLVLPNGESLIGGEEYTLEINRGDNKDLVTATTTMVSDIEIRDPDTDPDGALPINWVRSGLKVGWRAEFDAHIFDVKIFLNILEQDQSNPGNDQLVTLEWKIEENEPAVLGTNFVRMDTRLTKLDLFNFLANRLTVDPNITRKFESIDILITAGGVELSDYINAGNANSGITSTQVIATYTNLSEGFGVFSSKNSAIHEGYELATETIDSLQENFRTRDLNFLH